MAEKYPSQSLPDETTASGDQSEPMQDQSEIVVDKCGPMGNHYGLAVDQSEPTCNQHDQVADQTNPDPVHMPITDQASALQYAQKTGAATVNFTETQYNISGSQTIQNIYYPGQTQQSTSDMAKKTAATFNLPECQEELRAYYLEETGKVNLLLWIPEETKDMESIFVDLELVKTGKSKALENMKSNEDLVTLENKQGKRVNRVLVTGDAGSGKSTTACNLVYKWALNDPQSPLSKFTLVFFIRMKDIEDSNLSLVDLIFQHILTEESSVSKEGLHMYIKENAKDILFVIDGMNEDCSGALKNKSSEITKLLQNMKLRKSCVILTSRPREINNLGSDYTQLKLEGFSFKNIHKYIDNFFRDNAEKDKMKNLKKNTSVTFSHSHKVKVDSLFRKLEAEPHILALASIPVLLLMICMLWEDQRITPKTKTQLYQKTITYLWHRYESKRGGDPTYYEHSDNDGFNEELNDLLKKLGEVALLNISIDGDRLTFTEKEFGTDECNLGCQVGILRIEQSRAGIERKTSVTFSHVTFQYFCAAVHLTYLLDTKQSKMDDYDGKLFTSLSKHEFFYKHFVLEFCCGMQPEVTTTFLQYQMECSVKPASEVIDFDISIHMRHIFEGQLSYEQCSNLIPLFSSYRAAIVLTEDLIPSVIYMLDLYKSSATQTGFLSTIELLKVNTGCTPWLPTLLKHTYNLHHCRVILGVSGIVEELNIIFKALSELTNIKELVLINLGIRVFHFPRFDATNLLNFLTENGVKLTHFVLYGLQFDEKVMVRFLSSISSSILRLGLGGTIDARGQFATIDHVIEHLPRLELKHLNCIQLSNFQLHNAIKFLRPIISRLTVFDLTNCCLREEHLKELFSFLSRAQELVEIDLSQNVFSVASVLALVESIKTIPALVELSLEDTGLNDESACILARFVGEKPSINFLALDDNPGIGHVGKVALRGLPLKRYVLSSKYDLEYEDL